LVNPSCAHARLAFRAILPIVHQHFVAPNMDVGSGKKRANLRQDILDESKRVVVASAINPVENPAGQVGGERPARATELRVGHQRGARMSRHFNLGHNFNVPGLRVSDHLPNVLLRVVTAITAIRAVSRAGLGLQSKTNRLAPGPHFGQARILFDFDAPPLVIHQMPVEDIELVPRHFVQKPLDFLFGEKMAAYVQHQAAPTEARLVFDANARNQPT
jgi:hypothetical protein